MGHLYQRQYRHGKTGDLWRAGGSRARRRGSGAGSRSALRLNALLGDERFLGALARAANPSDDIEVVASDEDQRGCSRVVLLDSLLGSQTAEAEGVREVLQNSAGNTLCDGFTGIACAVSSSTTMQQPPCG